MALYPIITNDPDIKRVNKAIFKRLYLRATGLKPNTINSIFNYLPEERVAKRYVEMVNMGLEPKSLFKRNDIDFYTVWLYMQKAEDWEIKEKILAKLDDLLLEIWDWTPQMMWGMNNEVSNSAANIMMSQWQQNATDEDLITRWSSDLNNTVS